MLKEKSSTSEKIKEHFKCSECNFKSSSKQGLKVHVKRKHTSSSIQYPVTCELCDTQLENGNDLKKHMKTHSYKKATYQCEDCNFVGENKPTMEVHLGRAHS